MAKKRANGEGTIYRTANGRWRALISTGRDPKTGKLRRLSISGRTRQEVALKLAEALSQKEKGLLVEPTNQTVEQFLRSWLEDSVKPSVRPNTYENYGYAIRGHIIPALGPIPLARLSPQHVQHFLKTEQEKGLTRMVTLCYAVLRKSLAQAVRWGLIPRNPAELVDRPKVAKKEMLVLTPEQVNTLLEAAQGHRLYALFLLAVTAGLREGELLGLKWADIDLEAGALMVRRQLQWLNGQAVFSEPKSAKSRRRVVLPSIAVNALKKHRARQLEERLKLGGAWQENDLVFPSAVGTPLDPSHLRRSFNLILEKAGLPRVRFHDLRHTAATLLLAQGVHPKLVQEQLGHSQVSMTLDTYSHVLPGMTREAAEKMDALFGAKKRTR